MYGLLVNSFTAVTFGPYIFSGPPSVRMFREIWSPPICLGPDGGGGAMLSPSSWKHCQHLEIVVILDTQKPTAAATTLRNMNAWVG